MKYVARLALIALTLLFYSACSNEELERERQRTQQEQQARQTAEQQRQDAEKKRQEAEHKREAEQKARQAAEQESSNWRLVVGAISVLAICLLFFGIALGSAARKDAKAKRDSAE